MKVGILGFAHGHVGMYCGRWRACPEMGIELTAGWDHDADRLGAAAAAHDLTPYDTPDALLASGVEAVVIGAETSRHAELVELAAAAGKAIVLQKPLCLTMAQADRIVEAVARSGVRFTVAWQMRADPDNLKIADLLRSGTLGRVFTVRRRHGLATQQMANFENLWHVDPACNRDIWADDAAHPVDFLYWLFGMPRSVTAEMASLLNPRVPNDNGVAIYRYADGMIAEVSSSFVCLAHENTTEVVAEKGVVIQNYGDGPSMSAPRPENAPGLKWYLAEDQQWHFGAPTVFKHQGHRIENLAGPLADFLCGRRGPIATAEEGRDTLRMILATYVSARQGRRVMMDDREIESV